MARLDRVLVAAALAAAAGPVSGQGAAAYPEFDGAALKQGRTVWMGTCRDCHANPMADAPQVKDAAAWAPRVKKGKDALYVSALKGMATAKGEMPARGGNSSLSDAEVKLAVDYMVELVTRGVKAR